MKLRISEDLVLGADFVTSTQAILAQKGKGKSYTAAVEAEELLDAGQLVVIIDPTDAHFGLRSSPDGRETGYPIAVFGGDHGDVQLEPGGGAVLAEAIVRERFSAIVCTETMTKGEELRFVGDFLETLYRKNREAMHLFIDESDIFAPQQPYGGEAKTCGATDDIVRRGRKKGIGCTLITQRASVLNKNVLSQADMLIAMGCSHPLDLDAIDKWVRRNADPKRAKEMMDSLPSLPRGMAWAWNPSQHLFKKIAIRQRRTFDSGATPRAGEKKREPKVLAPVDLARLGEAMTAAVQRQKDNDPKELKKQVADLRRELERTSKARDRPVAATKIKEKIVVKTVEVVKPADLRRLEDLVKKIDKLILRITGTHADLELHLSGLRAEAGKLKEVATRVAQLRGKKSDPRALLDDVLKLAPDAHLALPPTKAAVAPPAALKKKPVVPKNGDAPSTNGARVGESEVFLKPAHLRILTAIAWWESIGVSTPDLGGVAFIAGTSTKSSAFDNNRSYLRARSYVDYPSSGRVQLTELGRSLAPPSDVPPTNEALHDVIFQKVTPAHGRLLRTLIEAYPGELSLEDFAAKAGTSITSSAFDNNRSWLRARGLAEYPRTGFVRATQLLFPCERG